VLHIVNKSPLERSSLDSCLRTARGGTLLLIEDAVYAACRGHACAGAISEAARRMQVCVLQPDLEARGVDGRLVDGVTAVDYGGFVDLVAEHPASHSWL
jgi:tRNA 2-thiouridine synthesizing protein B